MNKAIFITVRTSSTRLPRKPLLDFQGAPTIEYLIKRMKCSKRADKLILCTTENSCDDILVEIAARNRIEHFRGNENDKLERWRAAVEKFHVDFFVTADGDDLFCEPKLIDLAFEQFAKSNADFIQSTGIVCGAFTYGIKAEALNKVCAIKGSEDTEIMWVYFTETNLFEVEELKNVPAGYYRDDIRMTLDYKEDLDFFNEVLHLSEKSNEHLSLDEILEVIDKNPYVKEINFFRQHEFLDNQKAKTNLVLKEEDDFREKTNNS